MEDGKVTWMRSSQHKKDLAVPTNSAIGPSPVLRRAATLKNPTTCTLASDVISHNLIHHHGGVTSGRFKLEVSSATDQEGLHFYVGSTGLLQKPVGVSGGGRSNVRNATKCVLINTITILITAVKHFVVY